MRIERIAPPPLRRSLVGAVAGDERSLSIGRCEAARRVDIVGRRRCDGGDGHVRASGSAISISTRAHAWSLDGTHFADEVKHEENKLLLAALKLMSAKRAE